MLYWRENGNDTRYCTLVSCTARSTGSLGYFHRRSLWIPVQAQQASNKRRKSITLHSTLPPNQLSRGSISTHLSTANNNIDATYFLILLQSCIVQERSALLIPLLTQRQTFFQVAPGLIHRHILTRNTIEPLFHFFASLPKAHKPVTVFLLL
jgi:hypothetical protein